jgi:hypothetical protein
MRDFKLDWKRWSVAERITATGGAMFIVLAYSLLIGIAV